METIADRIKQKRIEYKHTLRSLGTALRLAHTTISQWERGIAEPSGKNLIALAELFKTSPEWLTDGESSIKILRSGYKLTKLVNFYEQKSQGIIPIEFIDELNINNVYLHRMEGDSMSPLINKNSIVAFNIKDKKISDGNIYFFEHGNIKRIKQIKKMPNSINLISFNQNYEEELVQINELNIIGKIFWISNKLD